MLSYRKNRVVEKTLRGCEILRAVELLAPLIDDIWNLTANFVAFEHGPVDVEVYRANKYHPETLRLSVEFEKKVFACPYRKELLELVDEIVGRCALQYQGAFASPKKNLTHHKGTPWDRAYAR